MMTVVFVDVNLMLSFGILWLNIFLTFIIVTPICWEVFDYSLERSFNCLNGPIYLKGILAVRYWADLTKVRGVSRV